MQSKLLELEKRYEAELREIITNFLLPLRANIERMQAAAVTRMENCNIIFGNIESTSFSLISLIHG